MSFMPGKSILLRDVRKALRRLIEDDDSLRSGLGDSYWPLLYDELCAFDSASRTWKSRLTRSIGAIPSARRSLVDCSFSFCCLMQGEDQGDLVFT